MDFFRGGLREALPQPDVEQLSRKIRQLECFLQSLRWRHSSKDFKVFGVVGSGLDIHRLLPP